MKKFKLFVLSLMVAGGIFLAANPSTALDTNPTMTVTADLVTPVSIAMVGAGTLAFGTMVAPHDDLPANVITDERYILNADATFEVQASGGGGVGTGEFVQEPTSARVIAQALITAAALDVVTVSTQATVATPQACTGGVANKVEFLGGLFANITAPGPGIPSLNVTIPSGETTATVNIGGILGIDEGADGAYTCLVAVIAFPTPGAGGGGGG